MLLIEPVWNRNYLDSAGKVTIGFAFNRTSMESKPIYIDEQISAAFILLIEPVWNRNQASDPSTKRNAPSFNRTSMESKLIRAPARSTHSLSF